MTEVTRILNELARGGESGESDELLPLIYTELRALAHQRMRREASGKSIDATELVHEAYLRLVNTGSPVSWEGRGHFFAAASEAMRRILVERARQRKTLKRGGEQRKVEFDDRLYMSDHDDERLLLLDDALKHLEASDPLRSELVKLRYFAGFTVSEAAQVLGISKTKAERMWTFTRAWLQTELSDP